MASSFKNFSPLAVIAALLLACPGDGTSTSDTATTTAATDTMPATDTTPTTTSGESTSASASGSATDSTSDLTTSGTPTTGTPGTPTTTGDTTTGDTMTGNTTTDDTGTSTSGGDACQDLAGVNFGPCEAIVGVGLVDGKCVDISGCGCEPHCDAFFADPVECATTCAGAGVCNEGLIQGRGLLAGPCTMATEFDDTHICGGDQASITQLVPADCSEPGGFPCGDASMCFLPWGSFTDEQWQSICAISLLPGVELVACTLYGP